MEYKFLKYSKIIKEFNKNSDFYKNKDIKNYFKFNKIYNKIININNIKNINLDIIITYLKLLIHNKLINLSTEYIVEFRNDIDQK